MVPPAVLHYHMQRLLLQMTSITNPNTQMVMKELIGLNDCMIFNKACNPEANLLQDANTNSTSPWGLIDSLAKNEWKGQMYRADNPPETIKFIEITLPWKTKFTRMSYIVCLKLKMIPTLATSQRIKWRSLVAKLFRQFTHRCINT